jgi:hypothetical protein
MGFWREAKQVLTLGGSYREEKASNRRSRAENNYQELIDQIDSQNQRIDTCYERLKLRFERTKLTLKTARKVLFPPCVSRRTHGTTSALPISISTAAATNLSFSREHRLESGYARAVIAPVVGISAAIAAWTCVQVLGIASTGTAIGGLSGAAASNAGWAAFGGGSLAAGGGGMALGHIILPGFGIAVCVGIFAMQSHRNANRLNGEADSFEAANLTNKSVLATVSRQVESLESAERSFDFEDDSLSDSLQDCRRLLFRYGWVSEIYRYIRFRISGIYYTHEEQPAVDSLNYAVACFLSKYGACD